MMPDIDIFYSFNDKDYIEVKEHDKKVKELEQEIERLNNELENVKAHYETEAEAKYYEYIDNHESKLQQRIDKVIEYINDNVAVYAFGNKELPHWELDDYNIQDLLKILKGEDNE